MAEAATRPQVGAVTLWATLLVAFLGWMFDGLEMGLYSWAVPPGLKDLLHTTDDQYIQRYIGYTVALFLLGMSAGGILFGRLGDRWGRVRTMTATVLVYAVFTGLSGLSRNVWQLAGCRFLGAMGLGGEWGVGVALVMEAWPNTSRPVLAGLLGAASNVGFLIAASLTARLSHSAGWQGLPPWRVALLIGFAPAVLTLLVLMFVKESDRWRQASAGHRPSRFSDLFAPELRRNSLVGIAVSAVAVLGMWGVYQAWVQSWVEKLVSAGGTVDKSVVGAARAAVGVAMAYGSILGGFLGGVLAQKLGRRTSYALFCLGALASALVLFLGNDQFGPRLLWCAGVGGVFAASFFGWLPLYLPELFPTRLRATGEGLTFNCGRVISAAGVLGTGYLAQALGGPAHACALMAGIWAIGLVVIGFAPETKGCELPE
jgi:MFS family permease